MHCGAAKITTGYQSCMSYFPIIQILRKKLWALHQEWLKVYLPVANNRNKVYNLLDWCAAG